MAEEVTHTPEIERQMEANLLVHQFMMDVYDELLEEHDKLLSNPYTTPAGRVWWSKDDIQRNGIKEYKEPRRLEGWVNVFKTLNGNLYFAEGVHSTEEGAAKCVARIGVTKIEWVEGQT